MSLMIDIATDGEQLARVTWPFKAMPSKQEIGEVTTAALIPEGRGHITIAQHCAQNGRKTMQATVRRGTRIIETCEVIVQRSGKATLA